MKFKSLVVLFSALVVAGLMAGSAFAFGVNPNASQDQTGQALVFGYYDTRSMADGGPGLTDNYFTVVNTDSVYTQAHVRVRTGERSIELLDFDIILTPWDVFAFDIYAIDGHIWFTSCDTHTLIQSGFNLNFDRNGDLVNDCVLYTSNPASQFYFAGLTTLIEYCTGATTDEAVAQTLKGYAEVIKEGDFVLDEPGGNPDCMDVPPGITLYDWWWNIGCEVGNWSPNLGGKVYYADTMGLWPAALVKLGDQNAYAYSWFTDGDVIMHQNSYVEELNFLTLDPNGIALWAPNYAYDDALAAPLGAWDMNLCFFNVAPGVVNRVGAAATYGPTLADNDYDPGTAYLGRIDQGWPVDWQRTVAQVDSLSTDIFAGIANGVTWCMTGGGIDYCYANSSSVLVSHFFNFPPLMSASYVMTIPTMHFIDQNVQITEDLVFDTEENDCIIPPGKFISPGLPDAPSLAQEVNIIRPDSCQAFVEGWRAYFIEVVADGPGINAPGFYDYYNDGAADDRFSVFPGSYSPLSISFTMTDGDDVFTTAPMLKDPFSHFPIFWCDDAQCRIP